MPIFGSDSAPRSLYSLHAMALQFARTPFLRLHRTVHSNSIQARTGGAALGLRNQTGWLSAQVRKHNDRVRIYTRRGADWTKRFPRIVKAVQRLRVSSVLLDGE